MGKLYFVIVMSGMQLSSEQITVFAIKVKLSAVAQGANRVHHLVMMPSTSVICCCWRVRGAGVDGMKVVGDNIWSCNSIGSGGWGNGPNKWNQLWRIWEVGGTERAGTNKANFEGCWAKKKPRGMEKARTNKANFGICTSTQWRRVRPTTKSSRYWCQKCSNKKDLLLFQLCSHKVISCI